MSTMTLGGFSSIAGDVPVDPDHDEAQQWILEELSKPEYQAAKPTWWDQLNKAFWDWLGSLSFGGDGGFQFPFIAVLLLVITGVIVAAFFIFGKPRLRHRSSVIGSLFGDDEDRSAEALRRSASSAAAREDWTLAIEELFRSLARVLAERVLVSTDPGTTAHGFAKRAGAVFPEHEVRLSASAAVFDNVRYLGQSGTESDYTALAELERELRVAIPPAPSTTFLASVQ
jgi:hypothetical protein